MGTRAGSIIATIITTHMPRNEPAAPGHDWPGIRIHAIDIVQPPAIGISSMRDMDAHHKPVRAELAAKSSAERPRNGLSWTAGRWAMRGALQPREVATSMGASALAVLVMTTPPDVRLVAAPGGAIEPLIHAPETVQAPRIGRIGVVDDAVLEHESAEARPLACVGRRIGSAHGREGGRPLSRAFPGRLAPVVVFDAAVALLLLAEPDAEVGVEV